MRLKNYNEDLVLETVKIVLRDRKDIHPTARLRAGRGGVRVEQDSAEIHHQRAGLHPRVHPGEQRQRGARGTAAERHRADHPRQPRGGCRGAPPPGQRSGTARASRPAPAEDADLHLTYFYNMPHIFGRIVDAGDGAPIIAAEATLWINERVSVPAEPGWRNPYTTNEQTKGYFSFWPQVEMGETEAIRVEMRIGFEHGRYAPFTFRKTLKVPGDFFVHDYIRGDKLLDIGTLSLQPA